jgi:hypothetical protein
MPRRDAREGHLRTDFVGTVVAFEGHGVVAWTPVVAVHREGADAASRLLWQLDRTIRRRDCGDAVDVHLGVPRC